MVKDKEQDALYDILMTKVDVRIGEWGLYNFYKMQVCCYIKCQELSSFFGSFDKIIMSLYNYELSVIAVGIIVIVIDKSS